MKNPERLARLLTNTDRPIQFIFSGKSHPKDTEGKDIIRQIVNFANKSDIKRRIIFLENYDMDIARFLVRGVDVWLNNPRRPMEASGTSGMKAAVNGVLNMSISDGWWCEGYTEDGGWIIGSNESYDDLEYQDTVEAQTIYDMLENEVIPLFYTRSADNLPRAWIRRMKNSIKWIAPRFNTHRMLADYTERFYKPSIIKAIDFSKQDFTKAREFTRWKNDIRNAWHGISVRNVLMNSNTGESDIQNELNPKERQIKVGSQLSIRALIHLGGINPNDVSVELYYGPVDNWENIQEGCAAPMKFEKSEEHGQHWFTGSMKCKATGQHGVAVRILPKHPDLVNPYEMGLILWETSN